MHSASKPTPDKQSARSLVSLPSPIIRHTNAHIVYREARACTENVLLSTTRLPLHLPRSSARGPRASRLTWRRACRSPDRSRERLVMAVDPLKTAAPPLASSVRKKSAALRRRRPPVRALSTEGDGPLLRVRAHEARGRAANWGGARLPWRNARPAAACPQGAARAAMLPRAWVLRPLRP